ncbi:Transcriptional regulator of nonfermentable carbon utilization [Puccinia graminis f. sp. tritici]|uniref:Transcription activator of gluconeogenesis ERT1 n=2 Tax=Puccinia graminis f. sp. tritici TaxID=56615 RepID=E3KFS1_PUCGT|nr:uncharacterized protein PGTG_09159 [Puccinia graminis f. sp. tritici CRL 75-36-700-3]EFP83206.1 hypothetical protein PGTG_09159 [Puccinia graminis f. sp. tritici CRL 75-36-700-3]KAA1089094.1 Transcriptional regulator of nonfermentable carbon utilization [Puccinia graminis f. sp. tritici]KAA1136757.1 Transcriptional regulator of nonfermentable carbon utilization [Puccinia graminis f. sp. tritici]
MVAEVSTAAIQPHQYHHLNPSLLSTNRLLPQILTNTGRSSCASSSSSSSCGSSPATTHTSADSWNLKPQTITCKPNPPPARRKKASRACGHCQKAHLTCDDGRPCLRCTKRGLSKTCTDGVRKKAKYLSDYDDALLVRPRPSIKRASEDPLEVEDCKKVKVATDDRDCRLSISWADLDLLENVGIPQYPNVETSVLAGCETVGSANPTSQTWALGGLEEWLARFESGVSPSSSAALDNLISLQENVKQADQTSESRQRMQEWVTRINRLVEIRKLTMNITADDEWMLKRNLDRSLMELERIISLSGTPTMIWNTSGQILKVGDEFCMLTEWSREDLVGKHIETVFEPESLEEYLDMVESSIFPDQESNHHPSRPRSQGSKTSSRNLPQRSSSSASSSSMTSSPSLSSIPLIALSQASDSNLSRGPYSNDRPDLTSSFAQSKTSNQSYGERECKETIKWFGIRKACGRESIGCSFCFKVRKDLFDCPSTIIGNFLPILTRASYTDHSS